MDTNSIEHVQSLTFGGKEYRLALSHLWDEDHEYTGYNLFECAMGGEICQPIKLSSQSDCGSMDDYFRNASLVLNMNRTELSLDCEGYKTQIASAN